MLCSWARTGPDTPASAPSALRVWPRAARSGRRHAVRGYGRTDVARMRVQLARPAVIQDRERLDELLLRHLVDGIESDFKPVRGVPATIGPVVRPMWKNTMFRTIAAQRPERSRNREDLGPGGKAELQQTVGRSRACSRPSGRAIDHRVAVIVEIDFRQGLDAHHVTVANSASDALPSTEVRDRGHDGRGLGQIAQHDHDDARGGGHHPAARPASARVRRSPRSTCRGMS